MISRTKLTKLTRWLSVFRRRLTASLPNRAVTGGGIATAIAAHVLVVVPEMIVFEEFRRQVFEYVGFYFLDNPFPGIRFLGGIIGGYTAGYLTRDKWHVALVNGAGAVILGVFVFYISVVFRNIVLFVANGGLTGSLLLVIVMQPLFFMLLPFGLLYFFQSIFISPIGNLVSKLLYGLVPDESSDRASDGSSGLHLLAFRLVIPGLVLVVIFASVWWFIFYFEAQY